jgi:hypothetical protein
MRVAVIVCGNPRSFKRTYPFFKANVLDTLNPDVFIHTYNLEGKERPDVKVDGTPEEYINLWNPKAYEIEDLKFNYEHLQTMVPYFKSLYRSHEIMKDYEAVHEIKYDVILKTRADVKFCHPVKDSYLLPCLVQDVIFVSHFHDGLPNDYMFYSNRKMMEISCNCYFDTDKLNIYQPGGERLWWYCLNKAGFGYECFRFYASWPSHNEDGDRNVKPLSWFDIETIR